MLVTEVNIIKISDNRFDGNHPNDINIDSVRTGILLTTPEIGMPVKVMHNKGIFITSLVTEIINELTFKTENSTYKLEILTTIDIQS